MSFGLMLTGSDSPLTDFLGRVDDSPASGNIGIQTCEHTSPVHTVGSPSSQGSQSSPAIGFELPPYELSGLQARKDL